MSRSRAVWPSGWPAPGGDGKLHSPRPDADRRHGRRLQDAVSQGKTLDEAAADLVKRIRPSTIIGRPSTVEEVANMAVYIASPQASATTGASLRVEGGVVDSI